MLFDLHIKNIGKLEDARIRIGQFTVFAGPNNTGKSFVSKILYSIFDAMRENHAEAHINSIFSAVFVAINDANSRLSQVRSERIAGLFSLLREEIEALRSMVRETPAGDVKELKIIFPNLSKSVTKIREIIPDIHSSLSSLGSEMEGEDRSPLFHLRHSTRIIEDSLDRLESDLRDTDAAKFITLGIKDKIIENMSQNLQIWIPMDLRKPSDGPAIINLGDFVTFEFSHDTFNFQINHAYVDVLRRSSQPIYLESPVYWKLKDALEKLRINPDRWADLIGISEVPGYFYDLASALKSKYAGDMVFPDVYERLTGEDVLNGEMTISGSGDLAFKEDNFHYPLANTAMGATNIGILALLIKRKILNKGSIVFIDEPEAHLHPAWQVVMAKALFDLVKSGATIVIATHSVDILKWLEVHIKKHPEDEKLVALNKFPVNGDEFVERDFDYKIAAIKGELTKPFSDLYTAGL